VVERGFTPEGIRFGRGVMDVGEPMAVPVIRQLINWVQPAPGQLVIRDAPPGASCPVVASVRNSDFLLLVTEPTPFGLHDLKLMVQIGQELKLPMGVIINRDNGSVFLELDDFCQAARLPVLMRIPFERTIAEGIAQGLPLVEIHPEFSGRLQELVSQIVSAIQREVIT
jgi:MinD superfamily P-loop ATPase